jgi:hypothetical protein
MDSLEDMEEFTYDDDHILNANFDQEEMDRLLQTPSPIPVDNDEPEIDLFCHDEDLIDEDQSQHEQEESEDDEENQILQPTPIQSSYQQILQQEIQDHQLKDEILNKLIHLVKEGKHLTITKEEFQEQFNLIENPKFKPFYEEIKNFSLDKKTKSILCLTQPLPLGEETGTRTKIVMPQELGETILTKTHVMEIHPGTNALELTASERYW